jgi:hypothetical protein
MGDKNLLSRARESLSQHDENMLYISLLVGKKKILQLNLTCHAFDRTLVTLSVSQLNIVRQ